MVLVDIVALDHRRKRLYYRSCHRGMKEMDLLFSAFLKQHLATMSEKDCDEWDKLLALPDQILWSFWSAGFPKSCDVLPENLGERLGEKVKEYENNKMLKTNFLHSSTNCKYLLLHISI